MQQEQQRPVGDAAPGSSGVAAAADAAARQLGAARLSHLEGRVDAAVEEWEALAAARRPSAADVDALARKHSILKAKWMVRLRS